MSEPDCRYFKEGHCDAYCDKWDPVEIIPKPRMRRAHKFSLEFDDSKPCTCKGGCAYPGCPRESEYEGDADAN